MKYRISRTSDWQGDEKPCKNAILEDKISKNTYHLNVWEIDISSLKDLYELIDEVGRIIIEKENIEIYDDYRE